MAALFHETAKEDAGFPPGTSGIIREAEHAWALSAEQEAVVCSAI
jgi:hypothetical protein